MILEMTKVRILGPRERLEATLDVLQDLGSVHLAHTHADHGLDPVQRSPAEDRQARHLRRVLEDVEAVVERFDGRRGSVATAKEPATVRDFARWARLAARLRRRLEELDEREAALEDERALITKYRRFFEAFEPLLEQEREWEGARAYHVILRPGDRETVPALRKALRSEIGDEFELLTRRLPDDETAVLLLVSAAAEARVEELLARARVPELPVPEDYGGGALSTAMPRMLERLGAIPGEARAVRREREELWRRHGEELRRARSAIHDRLTELKALEQAAQTDGAFVLEGWVPSEQLTPLERRLADRLGPTVVVERLSIEEWAGEPAPVVLSNPRLFRPFEAITRMLPLPAYGSIDPTPYVGVFFPMFFGIILGDVGYGLILGLLALVLHLRSKPDTTVRAISEIAGACAAFTGIFGFLYGELFGDLGRRWLGLEPLAFDREEAIVPFLGFAVALGLVHILLGLILGAVGKLRGDPRGALGRGIAAVLVLLIAAALLAAMDVLPPAFFTPTLIAVLVAFPILIVVEGIIAPIELLSTLGNVLSYARIMALGTASVMMAVVANRLVGAMGSVVVGILFALLFHLVNFTLGVFSPTIHSLRLHYVEFFGKFYSPGGAEYRPLSHWRPDDRGRAAA